MNKSLKPSKVKRGKRGGGGGPKTQPQDFVETQVENARRAVERKLMYLSESNRASAPTRTGKRSTAGAGAGAGEGADGRDGAGTAGAGIVAHARGQRRRRSRRSPALAATQETTDEEHKSSVETTYKCENRRRSGYNLLLSPRRNGLTPRNYEAEAAEMEAIMAAQRTSSGTTKPGQADGDVGEYQAGTFGRLQLKPLSSYATGHQLPSYSCGVCGAKFHIRSLLGAHRHIHDDDFKVRFRVRRKRESSTTMAAVHLCKYCDRAFDLERTLHIHQLSYCKKIPPQLRRKLAFTELAHEKKAPLPNFQRTQQQQAQGNSATTKQQQLTQQEKLHKIIMRESAVHERWR
ncbi:uncharacterized protein LOC6525802 [Drosophila yakuba]|uniref:C2H2-type domain-containing protein n=1 Tax=Drosophila yakuba TaxID=7245 RepID=B4Q2Z7_DROYA|nr:uncharacterized protein LOC6525802 [Drosophila yakuba]EDX02731.1 uncharacterized protein Dyak_GE15516 [Drosophila yakuba]